MIIPFRVAVGSANPVKVRAVQAVMKQIFPDAEVQGYDVPSNVSPQPIGEEETKRGAIHRARAALQVGQADWAFGLEAGVKFDTHGIAWLGGVVAVVDSEGNVSTSSEFSLALPYEVGRELREGGELGPIIDRLSGLSDTKKGIGAIGFLTSGLITREESWKSKIVYACTPLLHEDWYGEVRKRLNAQASDSDNGKRTINTDAQVEHVENPVHDKDLTKQEHVGDLQPFPFSGRTLDVFQNFHIWLDEQKQFDPDPILNTTLLSIEVGELGKEIAKAYLKAKRTMKKTDSSAKEWELDMFQAAFRDALKEYREEIGSELADCLAYVLKLANYTGIDLETAYLMKMKKNIQRSWD
jgi:inosine/xanthosine triphosphatase